MKCSHAAVTGSSSFSAPWGIYQRVGMVPYLLPRKTDKRILPNVYISLTIVPMRGKYSYVSFLSVHCS